MTSPNTVWCLRCKAETENPRGNPFRRDGKLSVDTCEECPAYAQGAMPIPPEAEIMPQAEKVKRGLISVINCQRCNKKIKREPDKRFCYPCSKKLVDGPALARTFDR